MTSQLLALTFDANDPEALARFWSGVLRWQPADATTLLPDADAVFQLRFLPTDEPKRWPNQTHFDIASRTDDEQRETVERALSLGARHLDVGQKPDEDHVVLADPEGNEFCVIEAGNNFLAGCGFIGCLSSDGTHACGTFWSRALDWPLVWDQDEETAVQASTGGTKISWGGTPLAHREGRNRTHLDLVVPSGAGSVDDEVERLLALGATRVDGAGDDVPWTVLADPDGNEFWLHPSR
ncbi:VOC family protein [Angustibacter peucedani]